MKRYYLLVATLAVAASLGSAVAAETFPPPVHRVTRIGERTADGTIYAGIAQRRDDAGTETNERLYTTPEGPRNRYNWREAAEYCAAMKTQAQPDWRVPTKDELNVLYQNYDAIGGFDTSGRESFGWYWSSSSEDGDNAWAQRFSDGLKYRNLKKNDASVRCVR